MKKIWMSTVAIFCTLIFMCFQSYAEGCRPITTWSSSDTASFTSNQATVYDYINTPYPIPNLGGALVTSVTINLTNGPGIRIWSHEDDLAAVATLANYLASTTWRSANSHYYDGYYLIYKVDDKGMVKTLDLISNYRGNLVEISSYFFGERLLSGELPIYASWFSQVKALIDAKCSGSCGAGKIPLPEGVLAFDSLSEMASSPISGCDPETIRPMAMVNSNFHLKLCSFEAPVDIYLGTIDPLSAWVYLLDQQLHPVSILRPEPFRRHVTGETDVMIPNRFGGLWGDEVLTSKDIHQILLAVVPSGGDFSNLYLWQESVSVKCQNRIPLPSSEQFFFYEPHPTVVTGSEPEHIKPLAVGAYAVGEDLINLHYDFCPFEAGVDIHLAVYCPDRDPQNVYFMVNRDVEIHAPEQITEELLFEKIGINDLDVLPQSCWEKRISFSDWMASPSTFFAGLASQQTAGNCYCMIAVTPEGVRNRYYAWISHLNVDLKDAIIRFYRERVK